MTPEQVLAAVEKYRSLFEANRLPKHSFPLDKPHPQYIDQAAHCHDMLDSIVAFVEDGKIGKAYRWLGFVQCFLWMNGFCTIDDMREDNRS